MIVMADGTVLALDVVVVGTGDKAQETARRKRFGWGSLGALERAKRARAATWERVRLAEEDGSMKRREAEEERQKAAGLVQQAYSGGYEHPIEVGGAVFTPLVLSPYGGWHGGCGNEQRGQAGRRIKEMMRRSSRTTSGSSTRLGRGRARPTGSSPTRRWGLRWRRRHLGLCRRQRRRR